MKSLTPLHAAIESLPEAASLAIPDLARKSNRLFGESEAAAVQHLFITGCGDSYHAGVAAAMTFKRYSGLHSVTPLTAMQFARYQAAYLPPPETAPSLVIGISVSGQVSRTAEALELARLAGARTLAITANLDGPLAQVADSILIPTPLPAIDVQPGTILPGSGSYLTSLIALIQVALRLGRLNGRLTAAAWQEQQAELLGLAGQMQVVIETNDLLVAERLGSWVDAEHFVYCGSGPNYGTAMFCAAKLIEASGDDALAQDVEEWAHLQYFGRAVRTPTILISASGRDAGRALEVAEAARAIGRRLGIVAPSGSALARAAAGHELFAYGAATQECYSPLLSSLPGLLLAAHRANQLDEPYFRGFAGGRSAQGGGGVSRIRDSHRIHQLPR